LNKVSTSSITSIYPKYSLSLDKRSPESDALIFTNSLISSIFYSDSPLVLSSSATTSQGSLSSLSIEEQIVLNKAGSHPVFLIRA
jgi:hypothetical protein